MDLNRATLLGHVVHTPRSRKLPSGDTMARFSLATNSISRDPRTMETKRGVDYHEIAAFGRLAGVVLRYVTSGMHLLVEGKLRNREYVGKGGVKVKTTEIVLAQLVMLGPKRTQDSAAREVPSSGTVETA